MKDRARIQALEEKVRELQLDLMKADLELTDRQKTIFLLQQNIRGVELKNRVNEKLLEILALGCKFREQGPEAVYGTNPG